MSQSGKENDPYAVWRDNLTKTFEDQKQPGAFLNYISTNEDVVGQLLDGLKDNKDFMLKEENKVFYEAAKTLEGVGNDTNLPKAKAFITTFDNTEKLRQEASKEKQKAMSDISPGTGLTTKNKIDRARGVSG